MADDSSALGPISYRTATAVSNRVSRRHANRWGVLTDAEFDAAKAKVLAS